MLNQQNVAPYLLGCGLLTPAAVVLGDVVALDLSRRNSSLAVIAPGAAYLIKQSWGSEKTAGVGREAAIYRVLHAVAGADLERFLPQLYLYDQDQQALILELFPNAEPLSIYHVRRGRFPRSLAAMLGAGLALLHAPTIAKADGVAAELIPLEPPWPLAAHRPSLDAYRSFSSANLQLFGAIQRFPQFGDLLDELRAEWRQKALIHYDIKLDNLLITHRPPARTQRLKIIDWEAAGLGDPGWDVGSVFGEYLAVWLRSIPTIPGEAPDRHLQRARYPLHKIQPALGSFWRAYAAQAGLNPTQAMLLLERATRYAAVRLLQTAFEQDQNSARPAPNSFLLLQLAFNILQRPLEALEHLVGISRFVAQLQ